jgi:rare lipoprotein A
VKSSSEKYRGRFIPLVALWVICLLLFTGCAGRRPPAKVKRPPRAKTGIASYIGHKFHGRRTASGEKYNENKMTAAHPFYPFGTLVRVTNLENGKSVTLRINDRGPSRRGRIIDVSYRAAKKLGFVRKGLIKVKVEVIR